MDEFSNKLKLYSHLIDENTFINTKIIDYNEFYYQQICSPNKDFSFFENYWTKKFEDNLISVINYCGVFWSYYSFDLFYSFYSQYEIEYYTEKYISSSSKTIKEYFSKNPLEVFNSKFEEYPKTWKTVFRNLPPKPEDVSKKFYYDLSDFLLLKGIDLLNSKRVSENDRIRLSKATGKEFKDSNSGNSRSFYNRTIKLWDKQNFQINYSREDFEPFKIIGSDEDVKKSISNLRDLLDFLEFIPKENGTAYDIFQSIGKEKYSEFYKIAKNCFWPSRYSLVFGNWLSAIKESGFLGSEPIIKGIYGYRTLAKDGHICNSLVEKIIDDWFFSHNILHEKEPLYPKEVRRFVNKNIRGDWKINNTYIEYFGLQANKDYSRKTELKIMACNIFHINLIKLFPGDEFHLDNIFADYIST